MVSYVVFTPVYMNSPSVYELILRSLSSGNNENQKNFDLQDGFDNLLKIIFGVIDYNNVNKIKNRRFILTGTRSRIVISNVGSYKLFFFIKRKNLVQKTANNEATYV